MAVATDNDGLLIPYNKRVQKEFNKFAGSARQWSPNQHGTSCKNGTNAMDFDLDMQIVEYEFTATNWARAMDEKNLLGNGGFQLGDATADGVTGGRADAWKTFALDDGTTHAMVFEARAKTNRFARVLGGGATGRTADGGWVQRVIGLERSSTYRVSGRVRSSWAVDSQHDCSVGLDPTGQEENPRADSITWRRLAELHGVWTEFLSEPMRPATNSISVWLRGRTTFTGDKFAPFKADFDDFALRRVKTGVPPPAR